MLDGEVVFICPANGFTAVRTAATTAFALDFLTPNDADVFTVAGAGPIARHTILQMTRIRPLQEVRIASRTKQSAERLAEELRTIIQSASILAWDDLGKACAGAKIVVTATSSVDPILFLRDIGPGTVIAAVGSGIRERRELEGALLSEASRIYVEDQDTAWEEAGDLTQASEEGFIGQEATTPLYSLLSAPKPVRPDEIVVYKSVGMTWEDMACAAALSTALSG
jgi:ornithine cyclodeaminase